MIFISARQVTGLSLLAVMATITVGCAQDETPTVAATDGAPGGADPGDGGPGPAVEPANGIEPLPVSTFVFYRFVKVGPEKFAFHIYARDVLSGDQRLITTLNDEKETLGSNAGDRLSISPDRRWIAFSEDLKYEPADHHLIGRTRMIWKVSVDGKQLIRISPPIADWRPPCDPMVAKERNGCLANMFCEFISHKCTFDFWSERYEHPTFSGDGQTILAHLSTTACDNVGCIKFFLLHNPVIVVGKKVSFANRPLAPPKQLGPDQPGCSTFRPTISPDGKRLASSEIKCAGADSQGVIVSDPSGANPVHFPVRYCDHLEWRPDSQAVYCTRDNGLFLLSLADNKATGVLEFAKDISLDRISFSRDGRWLVAQLRNAETTNLLLLDQLATPLAPGVKFTTNLTEAAPIDFWPSF